MSQKILINQLELAYSPISNYDFTFLRKDPSVQKMLSDSSMYIISQRPVITFENLLMKSSEPILEFEIHQKNNPNFLKIRFPFLQELITKDTKTSVELHLYFQDKKNITTVGPFNDLRGIKLYQASNFLLWFTPEKFLHSYWTGQILADIENDFTNLTKYNVHYVGKATDQDIWKRLTGHSTLQDILSIENPLNHGSLPTDEIALLLFRFHNNLAINTYTPDDNNISDMVASVLGTNLPEEKTIYHDAEKALVKAMQPKYNKETYKSYPNSKDGLQKHALDAFSYTFMDPITLVYNQGTIVGGIDALGGDRLWIEDNQSMKIMKISI